MTALTEENRNLPLGGGDAIRCMHKVALTAHSKVSANCACRGLDTIWLVRSSGERWQWHFKPTHRRVGRMRTVGRY